MTDKKKIVLFYVVIGTFAVLLITGFIILGHLRDVQAQDGEEKRQGLVKDVQMQTVEESIGQNKMLILEEDFTAVNQFGKEVEIQSLEGKVWVFAQFYGSCPDCNSTNLAVLKELHDKYKGNPDFQIVTISVKPERDAVKLMKDMADHYAPGDDNWWFISADADEVNEFCNNYMGFFSFKDNEKFGKVEGELEILHDMRITVFDAEMTQWAMEDVAAPMKKGDTLATDLAKKKIDLTIDWALKKIQK